jgi:aryl-alcohol dehydrogenase-like predicted oxidoreductase
MIKGFATNEGTLRFVSRQKAYRDFYIKSSDFILSTLGMGSYSPEAYREENYTYSFKDSIKEGIKNGINLIDTAINYRYTKSEFEINEAIKELIDENVISRDEVVICSKGGFLPLSYPFPENPYTWIKETVINSGLANDSDIALDQHCMTAKYIDWSFEESRKNLGVDTIDIYYLHNPETQAGLKSRDEILSSIQEVFEVLEQKRLEKKLQYYGIASWNGFLYEPENFEYLSIKDIYDIANRVAKDNHGFRYVQFPYNLAKTHGYIYQNQEIDNLYYTAIMSAKKLGLEVITSSSLLRMNLFKRAFSAEISKILGEDLSDIQKALQFCRSAFGVTSSLFSTTSLEHLMEDISIKVIPKISNENYNKIYDL